MNVKGLKQRHIHALLEIIKWNRASYMEKAQKHLYPNPSDRGTPEPIFPHEASEQSRQTPHGSGVCEWYRDGAYKEQLAEFDELECILWKVKK
jgi:hypothetical protein